MTYPSTRLTLSGEAESGRMAVRNGMDFTHRGGALRTKGKTQTWRYPDDPAVSLRHGTKRYSQRYSGAFEPGEYNRRDRAAPLCRRNGPQSRSSGVPFAPRPSLSPATPRRI